MVDASPNGAWVTPRLWAQEFLLAGSGVGRPCGLSGIKPASATCKTACCTIAPAAPLVILNDQQLNAWVKRYDAAQILSSLGYPGCPGGSQKYLWMAVVGNAQDQAPSTC